MPLKLALALLFVTAALPLSGQVAPSATEGGLPLAAGGGFSDYNVNLGHGHMQGGAVWVDYYPSHLPASLHGLGIEAEVQDISLGGNSSQPANFRLDSYCGGVIYSWHHFHRFRPYAKLVLGIGAIDHHSSGPFKHETRTDYSPGGGVDLRVFRRIWARADYEYQIWPDLPASPSTNIYFDPQGITVGVLFDFRSPRSR